MDKWLSQNNVAKIIALIISIVLWAMVHIDSGTPVSPTTVMNSKVINNIKIEVTGFDSEKYVLYDLEPDNVTMEVKGKRTDLTMSFSDYRVKLDLKNIGPGTTTLPLSPEVPPGVTLISMSPSYIKVTIEAKETIEMPVTIVTKGTPAEGMQLGSPVLTGADHVNVTLPQSELQEIQKVQGTVDVTDLTESVKGKTVKLTAYDKHGQEMKNAEIEPASVEVDVPINKLYKSVPLEVNHTGSLPTGYVLSGISTDVEGVALYGPKQSLDAITSFPVTVDLGQFVGTSETNYTVNLAPPEGIDAIEPTTAQVTVKIEPAASRTIDNISVNLLNLSESLEAKFLNAADQHISLTVLGSQDQLGRLGTEDILATADLSGLVAGTHTVPIAIKLPDYIDLAEPGYNHSIQIELTEIADPAATVPDDSNAETGNGGADNSVPPTEPADNTETDTQDDGGTAGTNGTQSESKL